MQARKMRLIAFVYSMALIFAAGCPSGGARVGLPAPALSLERLGGGNMDLAQLKGQVVLVNFWATWCDPCVEEMPDMERIHREMEGQPFTLLSVSINKDSSDVEKFASKNNLSFPILLDSSGTFSQEWGTTGVPETFIIGPDGNVAYKKIGPIDYGETMKNIRSLLPKK